MTNLPSFLLAFLCLIAAVSCSNAAFRSLLQKLKPDRVAFRDFFRSEETDQDALLWWRQDVAPPVEKTKDAFPDTLDPQTPLTLPHEHNPKVTHFCFLIHGHRGLSRDLSYLQAVMQKEAYLNYAGEPLIVHNAVCNEGKTADGIAKGGERLVEEMIDIIRNQMESCPSEDVTISIVGNSLGGIYSRYAIAQLSRRCTQHTDEDGEEYWLLDGKYRIHFNVFLSTATPHLGLGQHTYLPLPRTAEIGVAHALGDTGKDLFRLTDMMKKMATSKEFLEPLKNFRKRIAYANAYGTDFPVPAQTAAFLNEGSDYPHTVEDFNEEQLFLATLHTPPSEDMLHHDEDISDQDELVKMSTSLDALGWKKVFVDIRKEIPIGVSWPQSLSRRNSEESKQQQVGLQSDQVVASKDVATAISSPKDNRFHLPIGHNMIVAFSRSRVSSYVFKGGRPVVDALARDLVDDIFSFSHCHSD